jgi:triosephosphate isomerase
MAKQTFLIAGNWKMNGLLVESMQTIKKLRSLALKKPLKQTRLVICPPTTLLRDLAEKIPGTGIRLGGQDCHSEKTGAFTGDISAPMLRDMVCDYVIVGHSERRQHHKESCSLVAAKATAAHKAKLISIICIGETEAERDAGKAKEVVYNQLLNSVPKSAHDKNTIIAYEPVWAIGTNKVPTEADIHDMHQFIVQTAQNELKQFEKEIVVLYGGSANEKNATRILSLKGVKGLLVGRASLTAESLWDIVEAAESVVSQS